MVPGDASSQEPEQNYCVGSGSYLLTRKVFLLHQFSLKLLRCGWAHFSFQFWPFHKVLEDNDVSNLKYLTIYSRSQIRLWNIQKKPGAEQKRLSSATMLVLVSRLQFLVKEKLICFNDFGRNPRSKPNRWFNSYLHS